jgi:hypothetical protein
VNVILFEKKEFTHAVKYLEMRLSWIVRVDPNSILNVFIRDTQRQSLE